jgi:hypothetical protein
MDSQTMQTLAQVPVIVILIYLTFRQQQQIDKLLETITEMQIKHSEALLKMTIEFSEKLYAKICQ